MYAQTSKNLLAIIKFIKIARLRKSKNKLIIKSTINTTKESLQNHINEQQHNHLLILSNNFTNIV